MPDDAIVYIAFTSSDLWPGRGWNFVFGQASIRWGVGVWSIYRKGDPDATEREYHKCLLRTIQTGTHETGHMFGMLHCTAWECNMNGSNSLEESDRRPLALCPECVAKLCWCTGAEPKARFRALADLSRKCGLEREAAFYEKSLKALEAAERVKPAQ
jgi:archaemetzincin